MCITKLSKGDREPIKNVFIKYSAAWRHGYASIQWNYVSIYNKNKIEKYMCTYSYM